MAQIVLYRRETRLRLEVESRLEKEAQTDGLTGIANRRTVDEILAREWANAVRSGEPLALLFLDADRFKRYNHRYGHQESDELLKMFALAMRGKARRPRDLTARYGGEEFVALLPDMPRERAAQAAEPIRQAVGRLACAA